MQRILLALLFLALAAFAQDRAAINGTVTGPAGALVTGATVDVRSTSTGLHRSSSTNQKGLYDMTPLPVGDYELSVSKTGFKPLTVSNISLQYAETRTVDAKLDVGATVLIAAILQSFGPPQERDAPLAKSTLRRPCSIYHISSLRGNKGVY